MKIVVLFFLLILSSCKTKEIEKTKIVEQLISKCKYISREADTSAFSEFKIEVLDCASNSNLDSVNLGYSILDAEYDINEIIKSTKDEFHRKGENYFLSKNSLFKNIPISRKYYLYLTKDKYYYRKIKIDTLISIYTIYLMKYSDVKYVDSNGIIHVPEPE